MRNTLDNISALLFVVGISGAGNSSALRFFEDVGFYPIDNLPLPLLSQFLSFTETNPKRFEHTAVLPDIDTTDKVESLLASLKNKQLLAKTVHLVFLDCSTPALIKRYSESRRPHPAFNPLLDKTIDDAIKRQRELLSPIKERADVVIDTSDYSIHDLRRTLKAFVDTIDKKSNSLIRVNFVSFGFKHGIPLDCDLVTDVRFLPNPYFIAELREKTGKDKEVSDYVLAATSAQEYLQRYSELLTFLLPHYIFEGKAYLNIGIGCTGGRHRSVAIAEELAKIVTFKDCLLSVRHRDLPHKNS